MKNGEPVGHFRKNFPEKIGKIMKIITKKSVGITPKGFEPKSKLYIKEDWIARD